MSLSSSLLSSRVECTHLLSLRNTLVLYELVFISFYSFLVGRGEHTALTLEPEPALCEMVI